VPAVIHGRTNIGAVLVEQRRGADRTRAFTVELQRGPHGIVATLLHAIHRRARVAIFVNINEVFANTGFQYSPTSIPFADSSTLPYGGPAGPIDHVGLCVVAGAGYVAQASPAFPQFFAEVVTEALACETTAVVFVPSPCIAGWKFKEGLTADLGKLAAQTGLFPMFRKRAGQPGEFKHLPEKAKRPPVEKWLGLQQRFEHLCRMENGEVKLRAGHEDQVAAIQTYADRNFPHLEALGRL
jgi:pyruvate ferredoxin oxidoreductase beta subunit